MHTPFYKTTASPEGINWLGNTVENSEEELCLFFSHNAPFYSKFSDYFEATASNNISQAIDSAFGNNTNLTKTAWFGGHMHIKDVSIISNWNSNVLGYRMPDSIEKWNDNNDDSDNGMAIIEVYSDGSIAVNFEKLKYEHN